MKIILLPSVGNVTKKDYFFTFHFLFWFEFLVLDDYFSFEMAR